MQAVDTRPSSRGPGNEAKVGFTPVCSAMLNIHDIMSVYMRVNMVGHVRHKIKLPVLYILQ